MVLDLFNGSILINSMDDNSSWEPERKRLSASEGIPYLLWRQKV
jgi:hypothetical protein